MAEHKSRGKESIKGRGKVEKKVGSGIKKGEGQSE